MYVKNKVQNTYHVLSVPYTVLSTGQAAQGRQVANAAEAEGLPPALSLEDAPPVVSKRTQRQIVIVRT